MFRPFRIRVARSTRVSPHFQRVTFTGVDEIGPAGPIRDLRIKLIFPTSGRLPTLPSSASDSDASWYADWRALPEDERGVMRTYSVRDFRRGDGDSSSAAAELDIDFVLHMDNPGPAATWAASASEGDELILIAPDRDDNSGAGIEFRPGDAEFVRLFGDETALPAIAKILSEWPKGVRGSAHIAIPCSADIQDFAVPEGVTVQWISRGESVSDTTSKADARLYPASFACSGSLLGSLQQLTTLGETANGARRMTCNGEIGKATSDCAGDYEEEIVWETPSYSRCGDRLTNEDSSQQTLCRAGHLENTYFWVAGESGVVVEMRRYLVKELGISRNQVSFMGYWKHGIAAKG